MKAFLMGTAAALVIAVVAGVSLTVMQPSTAKYYSTDDVRLGSAYGSPQSTSGSYLTEGAAMLSILLSISALILSWHSNKKAEYIQTTDFRAVQQVKENTAKLLAVCRSLMIKSALSSQANPEIVDKESFDIQKERDHIREFLVSTTAYAFYAWVARKSRLAQETGKAREEWRVFFIQLAEMSRSSDLHALGRFAAAIETLFEDVTEDDIKWISSRLSNLAAAHEEIIASRTHDVLISAYILNLNKNKTDEGDVLSMLLYIKHQKNIDDPDIDMWISVFNGDVDLLKSALDKGADRKIAWQTLLRKYAAELKEYGN